MIKNFAVWAREELLHQVSNQYYRITSQTEQSGSVRSKSRAVVFAIDEKKKEEWIENAAYTWFNRLIALRYMEVNHYLPECAGFSMEALCEMEDKEQAKETLIGVCNQLSVGLPELFPVINEQTERLLPKEVFLSDGLIHRLVVEIPKEEWKNAVEIIGWLHQYYNTEQKNQAFGALQKENVKISKERIPAVTQLFTPDWIVRYMVENSLGKLWVEQGGVAGNWKYYCTCDKKQAQKKAEDIDLDESRKVATELNPDRIKFIDPCMGSGHILVYAFELFMEMYLQAGYSEAEAARSIVQNNLYGLDIDPRAFQLSYFTLMMKARQYDPWILDGKMKPNVFVVEDSRFFSDAFVDFVAGEDLEMKCDLLTLGEDLYDAAEYGSLVELRPIDLDRLEKRAKEIQGSFYDDVLGALYAQQVQEKLMPLLAQARVMMQSYEVVVTNPPYMGKSAMDKKLREYVKKKYPLSNYDLYAVFIEKCDKMLAAGGYQGMITQHSWMFLGSYEALRKRILQTRTITHMIHLGARAFEEISGEVVQTTSWIMKKTQQPAGEGVYMRLVDCGNKKEQFFLEEKEQASHHITYVRRWEDFFKIPGAPVAYWVSKEQLPLFETTTVSDFATVTNGMFTCDNKRFLRLWHEIPKERIVLDCESKQQCIASEKKWFPYNKGGNFRRWYGNHEYVIDFKNFGEEIKEYRVQSGQSASFPGQDYYFRESLSWSLVSPSNFGIRYYPKGFVFDIAGSSIFPIQEEQTYAMLGILASKTSYEFLKVLNPTINYQAGDVRSIPMLKEALDHKEIGRLAKENVQLAKEEWDSHETSWNFREHPFVTIARTCLQSGDSKTKGVSIRWCFQEYKKQQELRMERMSKNENRLNALVEQIYRDFTGCETTAQSQENTSGKHLADKEMGNESVDYSSEMRAFLSYAIGCIFGRFDEMHTTETCRWLLLTKEDVMQKLKRFLEQCFGAQMLEENLRSIAKGIALKDEDPEDSILGYFQKDFFKDHSRMYQKRPLYWLSQSGKTHGFQALFYIHTYDQEVLEQIKAAAEKCFEVFQLQSQKEKCSAREKKQAIAKAEEIKTYLQKVENLCEHPVVLEEDDGILVNYSKLSSILV